MNGVNKGIVINGNGKIEAQNIVMGQNASIHIASQTNNKWLKVDNWIKENHLNIQNYESLQEQVNILKLQVNNNFSKEQKESIFKKITEAVGSITDAFGLIQLIKEIF